VPIALHINCIFRPIKTSWMVCKEEQHYCGHLEISVEGNVR